MVSRAARGSALQKRQSAASQSANPKIAAPRLPGDRNGKISEVTGYAVSGADRRLRCDVGGVHGNPRLLRSSIGPSQS
jgi:hypothetical protein